MKIGMDIGGSTIRIAIVKGDRTLFHSKEYPANINSNRFVLEEIKEEISKLATENVEIIGCAAAGGMEELTKNLFKNILSRFSKNVFIFPDISVAYFAVFGHGNGILALSGTGSVVYGKNGVKETVIGGLGYILGDEGSGFWIGKEFLKNALYEMQKGEKGTYANLAEKYFLKDNVHAIIEKVYGENPQFELSKFGRFAIENAGSDEIIKHGAEMLAEDAITAAKVLNFRNKVPVSVSGGVFSHSEYFSNVFFNRFGKTFEYKIQEANYPMEIAAIKLAEEKNAE